MASHGPNTFVKSQSNHLREWLTSENVTGDAIIERGQDVLLPHVLSVYKNANSFRVAIRRFFRGGSLNAKNRALVKKIAYEILTDRMSFETRTQTVQQLEKETDEQLEIENTPLVMTAPEPDVEIFNYVVMAPCPTCGQKAQVDLHPDGTWTILK